VRRTWYLLALVPFVVGAALAVVSFVRLFDNLDSMPRMVVPGEHEFALEAGDYVVYGESESIVDGTAYENGRFSVRCGLAAHDGAAIALSHPTVARTYSIGGHTGNGMFEFELPSDQTVTLSCTTEDGKAVVAIGRGIGGAIVAGVLSILLGLFGGLIIFVVVFIKRRRWRRREAEARAGAPAGSGSTAG
jgi:hypothetical protein